VDLDLETYARIAAELALAGAARADVLAKHGLDEDAWDDIDDGWQERLSAADDEVEAEDGVAPLVALFLAAYQAAQQGLAPPISIETLALVTRLVETSGDLGSALARSGVTLLDYVRGSEHWAPRLASDPDVARRFQVALRRRG
jgi:hypothetical protein